MQRIAVAILEDDPSTRAALSAAVVTDETLALVGTFSTAGEALSELATRIPDVLLLDLGLPDMRGVELVRILTQRFPAMEVLIFTAFGDETTVVACLEAGARGFLLKGTGVSNIGFNIRDIHAGGSPLSPQIARHLIKRMQPLVARTATASFHDIEALTPREREVLNAISRGFTYEEVGQLLSLQAGTVHTHLKNIYRKLAVRSKTEAVFEANRMGLLK